MLTEIEGYDSRYGGLFERNTLTLEGNTRKLFQSQVS